MIMANSSDADRQPWWRRWLIRPVLHQLSAGGSPDRLAWTIAAGVVLGIFPIMGSTTLLCLAAGWLFGLNQPVLHVFRAVVYPLHLALILVFIRMGERLYGANLIAFSIPQLVGRFKDDPLRFASDFGLAAWHGIAAWLLVSPLLLILIKLAVTPLLRAAKAKLGAGKEAS